MSATEWANLQEAMILVFGTLAQWFGVLILAGSVIAGIIYLWLSMLRYITR